jgi:ribosome maturation factor RimP
MIDKLHLMEIVKDTLGEGPVYLVGLKVSNDNRINIDLDGDNGVTIDDCINLSREINSKLDREIEDYELNVSSAGADSPLKLPRQYKRHIGRTLSVDTTDGAHHEAQLVAADDSSITLQTKGTKRQPAEELTFSFSEIRVAHVVVKI